MGDDDVGGVDVMLGLALGANAVADTKKERERIEFIMNGMESNRIMVQMFLNSSLEYV